MLRESLGSMLRESLGTRLRRESGRRPAGLEPLPRPSRPARDRQRARAPETPGGPIGPGRRGLGVTAAAAGAAGRLAMHRRAVPAEPPSRPIDADARLSHPPVELADPVLPVQPGRSGNAVDLLSSAPAQPTVFDTARQIGQRTAGRSAHGGKRTNEEEEEEAGTYGSRGDRVDWFLAFCRGFGVGFRRTTGRDRGDGRDGRHKGAALPERGRRCR